MPPTDSNRWEHGHAKVIMYGKSNAGKTDLTDSLFVPQADLGRTPRWAGAMLLDGALWSGGGSPGCAVFTGRLFWARRSRLVRLRVERLLSGVYHASLVSAWT
jgi:hypothetical protein